MGLCVHRLRANGKMRACARVVTSSRGQIAIASATGRGHATADACKRVCFASRGYGVCNITFHHHAFTSVVVERHRTKGCPPISLESGTDNYRAPLQQSQAQTQKHKQALTSRFTTDYSLSLSRPGLLPRTPLASLTRGKATLSRARVPNFHVAGGGDGPKRPGRHVSEQA